MKRKEMIKVLKSWEAFQRLNKAVGDINGGIGIDPIEYQGLYGLGDLIIQNSKYKNEQDVDFDNAIKNIFKEYGLRK